MKLSVIFEQLLNQQPLSSQQMSFMMQHCLSGKLTQAQLAAFLVLMRAKGERVEELTIAAQLMRQFATPIKLNQTVIDIVGTGGDGQHTFNISTLSSFIVAAAGIPVAKHGNVSVSSHSGSADVLKEAGFRLELSEAALQTCVERTNLCFLFAPYFQPAMQYALLVRSELKIRTFFNLLGPLIHPAGVQKQVVGVCAGHWQPILLDVLINTGSTRALVIHAQDGLDEVSVTCPTNILEYHQQQTTSWVIRPERYKSWHSSLDGMTVASARESLDIMHSVLAQEKSPARDITLLNAALGIYCGAVPYITFDEAFDIATHTLDSGLALTCFKQLQQLSITLN
ncbi:MAG: anthranilate phosphoribosyltransferase [Legionellaceae bacterium]|nr:anthranilate phosphoribosyltransferase [Legionellaceae bacterium]HAF87041.1 anthranilate phosphoribosyltransferase [Legionellales bacterium]|tara:strand:+ start:1292 stop:2311 length:1020 start_codon:yes stop_codon:yes gene_type:complete